MNPLIRLAASALPGDRRYLLLAGAGVSKDAGLPTAWDIMLETAKLLYCQDNGGTPDREELEAWFVGSSYAKMPYAEVIGNLYRTYPEQQAFLQKLLGGRELGEAHRLIAELARREIIRAIITTNFDDYVERALDSIGLDFQVLSTDEDLLNSEPLIQCKKVRVYKPHGTLGRGALRNTPEDLKRLSAPMEEELVRITSEHGLLVLGYSGSDAGILEVLRQRRRNFYPLFWVDPTTPKPDIMSFLEQRDYTYLPCKGAGAFLKDYFDLLDRLARIAPSESFGPKLHELEDVLKANSPAVGPGFTDYVSSLQAQLESDRPDFSKVVERDDAIVRQIDDGLEIVARFAEAARLAARYDNAPATKALYDFFGTLSRNCDVPEGFIGTFNDADFDGFRFLTYEMFVVLTASLIKYERWRLLALTLQDDLLITTHRGSQYERYTSLRLTTRSLEYRNQRLNLRRASVTSDLLKTRTESGPLAKLIPHREFMNADYLLFLRSVLLEVVVDANGHASLIDAWIPWSCVYLNSPPPYLLRAYQVRYAEELSAACGVTASEFISRVGPRYNQWVVAFKDAWLDGIRGFEPSLVGSRP